MKSFLKRISIQVAGILIATAIITFITKVYMKASILLGNNEFIFLFIIISIALIALLFSIHAYNLGKTCSDQTSIISNHTEQLDFITDTLKDVHSQFWFLKGDINRSMAYTFRGTPYTSFMLWLRSSESFNKSGDIDMARTSLKETLDAIKQVESVAHEDLNESNRLLADIDVANFRHEINAINDEIERLTRTTT